jgi:hypothetical protein
VNTNQLYGVCEYLIIFSGEGCGETKCPHSRMEFRLIVIVGTALFFSVMWIISLFRSDGFENMPVKIPPHVYSNPKSAYSNEDIAALINTLRKELSQHQQELPETIAKTIQDQVEPAIKGVLSRNYYVPQ